jgi:hypothetical protein
VALRNAFDHQNEGSLKRVGIDRALLVEDEADKSNDLIVLRKVLWDKILPNPYFYHP